MISDVQVLLFRPGTLERPKSVRDTTMMHNNMEIGRCNCLCHREPPPGYTDM
jgi:hypothetical protein